MKISGHTISHNVANLIKLQYILPSKTLQKYVGDNLSHWCSMNSVKKNEENQWCDIPFSTSIFPKDTDHIMHGMVMHIFFVGVEQNVPVDKWFFVSKYDTRKIPCGCASVSKEVQ